MKVAIDRQELDLKLSKLKDTISSLFVKKSGDTMSGTLTVNGYLYTTNNPDSMVQVSNGTKQIRLAVGSTNRYGIYDPNTTKWVFNVEPNGDLYLNGYSMEVVNSKVAVNGNYTTSANNELYCYRWGKFVYMTGWINNTVQVPTYTRVFTIPSGYRPISNVNISPINQTSQLWLFGGETNGEVSTQGTVLATGKHYFSACWLCA